LGFLFGSWVQVWIGGGWSEVCLSVGDWR